MKRSERSLLKNLRGQPNSETSFSNVKQGLGNVRHVVGNPMMKAEIQLTISLYFETLGGLIAPAALPVAMQNALPVYLFGLTDFYGAYNAARRILPPQNGWVAPIGNAWIYGYNPFGIPPVVAVFAEVGDMIIHFNDAPGVINGYVIVHCESPSYGTFLNSFVSDLITLNNIRMFVPLANINQLQNNIFFAVQTLFGKVFVDSIDPYTYKLPTEMQNQIADIPVKMPIDKSLILAFLMNFDCPQINMVFYVQKVEPLTNRR